MDDGALLVIEEQELVKKTVRFIKTGEITCEKCYFHEHGHCPWDCDDGYYVEHDPSHWHTGTPTEDGYYLCKVFYDKETKNDMRILEWVKELDCFCIPYSKVRAYHYYVGENNGENVEVVYEWQKLDMRFRMETKWIEPYKED